MFQELVSAPDCAAGVGVGAVEELLPLEEAAVTVAAAALVPLLGGSTGEGMPSPINEGFRAY